MLNLLAAQQQTVTAWPQRLLLTAIMIAVIALACWGMWRSWKRRASQQLPVQPVPEDFQEQIQAPGRYLGTSPADDWMQRVVANGMGAPGNAVAAVGPAGVLLTREGESDIFISGATITQTQIGRGIAAQVAEKDGVVLWSWQAGGTALCSGFRPDVPQDVVRLVQASEQFVGEEDQ